MNDYISRQAAIDEIDEWIKAFRENGHKESAADACLIQDGIIQLPPADVQPVRHGRWIPVFGGKFTGGAYWFGCSKCGHTVTGGNLSGKHFCENCGSRMQKGEET